MDNEYAGTLMAVACCVGWLQDAHPDTLARHKGAGEIRPHQGGSCSAKTVWDPCVNGSMDHEWDLWVHLFPFSVSL